MKKKPSSASDSGSNQRRRIILGVVLMLLSVALLISFLAYLFTWQADESVVGQLDRNLPSQNPLSKFGVAVSHFFIYQGFGVASFIFVYLFFVLGSYLFVGGNLTKLINSWLWGLLTALWWCLFLSLFWKDQAIVTGIIGYELKELLKDYIGTIGIILSLLFGLFLYLYLRLGIHPHRLWHRLRRAQHRPPAAEHDPQEETPPDDYTDEAIAADEYSDDDLPPPYIKNPAANARREPGAPFLSPTETAQVDFEIHTVPKEKEEKINLSERLVENYGAFDPTLELSGYQFPTLDLLEDYGESDITVNKAEIEENKNQIVRTLLNYKIEIQQIKATIGPTVTLYELVPAPGVKISKIKSLEDDIALSLSALGIRIIAPMPGKGTIGIEVPNKTPSTVSMHAVMASQKFQKADMTLPIALGKTISNETFVVDLVKMPHLLMAGATGQGKSVGLNVVLASLLYKKHPAEIKFVLIDPKRVELTLFRKIERHFLAKLPNTDEAIITDTAKVIYTLNSLCLEMDDRYALLESAEVKNIKEYNEKFKSRRLNPENGHRFLPYIAVIIDEFADLIMTAGKEVETPIARLAQLARAIGIHLIIATQRPSVNVITGLIKANFPARIAFRVTSKIDSRTILDGSGADQLIGRGDMLYTQGNDLIRVQCAFIDTPEVERVTEFIGAQKGYPEAYPLPEFTGEEGGTTLDIDPRERDAMFREAAEVIVIAQQGSTSLIQRKLKLGYARAGRIMDQLEAGGIVGPFEGSKARQVLIPDLAALERFFEAQK